MPILLNSLCDGEGFALLVPLPLLGVWGHRIAIQRAAPTLPVKKPPFCPPLGSPLGKTRVTPPKNKPPRRIFVIATKKLWMKLPMVLGDLSQFVQKEVSFFFFPNLESNQNPLNSTAQGLGRDWAPYKLFSPPENSPPFLLTVFENPSPANFLFWMSLKSLPHFSFCFSFIKVILAAPATTKRSCVLPQHQLPC